MSKNQKITVLSNYLRSSKKNMPQIAIFAISLIYLKNRKVFNFIFQGRLGN
jgi:hypothetical protein